MISGRWGKKLKQNYGSADQKQVNHPHRTQAITEEGGKGQRLMADGEAQKTLFYWNFRKRRERGRTEKILRKIMTANFQILAKDTNLQTPEKRNNFLPIGEAQFE